MYVNPLTNISYTWGITFSEIGRIILTGFGLLKIEITSSKKSSKIDENKAHRDPHLPRSLILNPDALKSCRLLVSTLPDHLKYKNKTG